MGACALLVGAMVAYSAALPFWWSLVVLEIGRAIFVDSLKWR